MYLRKWESRETVPFFLRPHPTPPPQIFLVQWKIPEDRLCNVAELWMESKTKTARRFTAKNPWWKNDFLEGGRIKFPKRFCMVGTRYFASATNYWYSIWYYNYGRTWSITSLPGLVFRRRRAVFPIPTKNNLWKFVLICGSKKRSKKNPCEKAIDWWTRCRVAWNRWA